MQTKTMLDVVGCAKERALPPPLNEVRSSAVENASPKLELYLIISEPVVSALSNVHPVMVIDWIVTCRKRALPDGLMLERKVEPDV